MPMARSYGSLYGVWQMARSFHSLYSVGLVRSACRCGLHLHEEIVFRFPLPAGRGLG
jgi:hypothetical protein